MNVSMKALNVAGFARMGGGLKSSQEKAERQQQCASQVDFFEQQKQNLKNMVCGSLEDIERKLDLFHSYEDQIAAVKMQYNKEQAGHVLDEAREIGEKIAEAAEEMAPKTPEERRKEAAEEAAGKDEENKGMLSEVMEEMDEVTEELEEQLEEELEGQLEEELEEQLEEGLEGQLEESLAGSLEGSLETSPQMIGGSLDAEEKMAMLRMQEEAKEEQAQQNLLKVPVIEAGQYRHIDFKV